MNSMHALHVYCQVGVTIRSPTAIVLGTLDRKRPKLQGARAQKSQGILGEQYRVTDLHHSVRECRDPANIDMKTKRAFCSRPGLYLCIWYHGRGESTHLKTRDCSRETLGVQIDVGSSPLGAGVRLQLSRGGGRRTHLLLALVIWPLTPHPFRDGASGGGEGAN